MIEIIAEAGLNHGGSVDVALEMCDAAMRAGAHAVKFQIYDPDALLHKNDPEYNLLQSLALPRKDWLRIAEHCNIVEFFATPGDLDSLKFLVEECGVKRVKIGSDDLTSAALLRAAYATGKPIILSTGMATIAEIHDATMDMDCDRVTLLQCTSEYPCPPANVNLSAMGDLMQFGFPVGYSDHTSGTAACLGAAALGAVMIEKHFKLHAYDEVIDRAVSIPAEGLRAMIAEVREMELMLGTGRKEPSAAELAARARLRKGPDGRRPLP